MHVLLCPAGSHGDVHPFVGLGRALLARGHRVTLVTGEPFRELAGRNGLAFAGLGTAEDYEAMIYHPDLWHPTRSMDVVFSGISVGRLARELFDRLRELHAPGETVAVAGTLAFGARVANEVLGLPLATVHLQPATMVSVAVPPVFASMRMRSWWPHWYRRLLYWVGDRFIVDRKLGRPLNAFRAEYGRPPLRHVYGRYLDSPRRMIGLFPKWYATAPDWKPQFRQTGFVRYDQAEAPLPPGLEEFLTAGPPPVVFSFGSAMRQGKPYFAAAAEACAFGGFRGLLLAKGGDQIPDPLPPGVAHFDYAPFSRVFPRAAAVAHHGGIGTTAQSLAAGVPQLVMPLAFDQPDNAARMERLGAGRTLPPRRFTPENVAAAVTALTGDTRYATSARECAAKLAADDPLPETCRLIEELASGP